MGKLDKKILKIIKNGFSLQDWESFPVEIRQNEFIIVDLLKLLAKVDIDRVKEVCDENPFVIKHLPYERQMEIVTNDNFEYLCDELQLEVVRQNEDKLKYASEEIQLKYATQNPFKLSYLSEENQRKLVASNEFFLEFASQDVQVAFARENIDLLCRCSNLIQCMFVKSNPNYYSKCGHDVKRDIIKLSNLSLEEVSVETLEHYMSVNYDKLPLHELREYSEKMGLANREDKDQIVEYLNYLIVNMEKKKM